MLRIGTAPNANVKFLGATDVKPEASGSIGGRGLDKRATNNRRVKRYARQYVEIDDSDARTDTGANVEEEEIKVCLVIFPTFPLFDKLDSRC